MIRNKTILITGISGFVGAHLAKRLADNGNEIYGLVRRRADGTIPKNIVDRNITPTLVEGDLLDISTVGEAIDKSEPDFIFHLGAQSFIPRSFAQPLESINVNTIGTANLLEAIRIKDFDPKLVFAGSSEEYGLVMSSQKQYQMLLKKYGIISPEPTEIPELPIKETNPLRPMSPYATSKVHGDFLLRNYYYVYGMKNIVSRGFNHEGAGRGIMFVTSVITSQVMKLKYNETDRIIIGNVNAFRDWSHIKDIVDGYILLAEKGRSGDVYNLGSMRTNSVMTYILKSLEMAGFKPNKIETIKNNKNKIIKNPCEESPEKIFGISFEKTKIDDALLRGELEFTLEDEGIWVYTDKKKILIKFNPNRFRQAEVPILIADSSKAEKIGFKITHPLKDVIKDQLNYYINPENRVLYNTLD